MDCEGLRKNSKETQREEPFLMWLFFSETHIIQGVFGLVSVEVAKFTVSLKETMLVFCSDRMGCPR